MTGTRLPDGQPRPPLEPYVVYYRAEQDRGQVNSTKLLYDLTAAWAEHKDARAEGDAEWIKSTKDYLVSLLDICLDLIGIDP